MLGAVAMEGHQHSLAKQAVYLEVSDEQHYAVEIERFRLCVCVCVGGGGGGGGRIKEHD